YDIFSNSSELGATDLERQTYLQYQLQENMRTTIQKMNKIEDCVVIVNLSDSSSFVLSSNTTEASVAVMLSLEKGETLEDSEARSIGEFVAKCVPGIKYENISIVDSDLNYYDILLDESTGGGSGGDYTTTQQELTERMREVLNDQVVSVLEPAMGTSNLAVSVNVELNFDKETTSEVLFSPPIEGKDDGLVRSSEVMTELSSDGSGDVASGEAGTDSNGVSATEYVNDDVTGNLIGKSTSETFNYEINEVRTDIEKAQGTIKSLSVSVIINSNVEGIENYREQVVNLIANAISVDPEYITVELIPFVQRSGESGFNDYLSQSEQELQAYNMSRLIRAGIIAGSILVAAAVLLIFLRRKRKKKEKTSGEAAAAEADANASSTHIGTNFSPEESRPNVEEMLGKLTMKKQGETEIVEELMERYPETVVQILRTWLAED
ncbi:MAG: hypothetical protein EOM14_14735, partial [Clostridia bacterium]|nr:hypothetical protein [Clostridia bacterium]